MQITFDPLVPAERDTVVKFLGLDFRAAGPVERVAQLRTQIAANLAEDAPPESLPRSGMTGEQLRAAYDASAPSADPLPQDPYLQGIMNRAPSPAAADLFSTVPAAPTAGIPMPPGADLPPVPVVPQPPVAPSAPATYESLAVNVELDKDGLPWNAEIHGSTKTKNADGRWRQRRNLDPAVLARVTGELRALMAAPAASAVPLPPTPAAPAMVPAPIGSVPPATIAPAPASVGADAGNAQAAIPLPPVTAPIPTPPAPAAPIAAAPTALSTGAVVSFPDLMTKITSAVTMRTITEAQVHEVLQQVAGVGPTQIGLLAARPDLVTAVAARIDHILAGGA